MSAFAWFSAAVDKARHCPSRVRQGCPRDGSHGIHRDGEEQSQVGGLLGRIDSDIGLGTEDAQRLVDDGREADQAWQLSMTSTPQA